MAMITPKSLSLKYFNNKSETYLGIPYKLSDWLNVDIWANFTTEVLAPSTE